MVQAADFLTVIKRLGEVIPETRPFTRQHQSRASGRGTNAIKIAFRLILQRRDGWTNGRMNQRSVRPTNRGTKLCLKKESEVLCGLDQDSDGVCWKIRAWSSFLFPLLLLFLIGLPQFYPAHSSNPIYEIYAQPSGEAEDSRNARVATLEQRIARLESTLGNNPEKLAMLKAENRAEGLLEAVEELQTKINLLNPKVVDLVDGRLGALQLRLQQIGEKKATNAAAAGQQQQLTEETAKRIEEIHGQVEKWESVCANLPNIADRMATLNDLHNRAVTFSQTLQQLEAMQKTISGNLTTQSSLVATVEATLAENLETIGKNCKALDERIVKLKK